jgi:hypothetical protein
MRPLKMLVMTNIMCIQREVGQILWRLDDVK